jgi:Ca2+-binding EF-hand superfamily protein
MDIVELRENFDHFDTNSDGHLSLIEFSRLLDALGAHMSDEEKRLGFGAIDTDGNGGIEFKEFVNWWNER